MVLPGVEEAWRHGGKKKAESEKKAWAGETCTSLVKNCTLFQTFYLLSGWLVAGTYTKDSDLESWGLLCSKLISCI